MKTPPVAMVTPLAALALGASVLLSGCGGSGSANPTPSSSSGSGSSSDPVIRYAAALSTPAVDSVYPRGGDPVVDSLHYDVSLHWDGTKLAGTQILTFRAARDADQWRLDLVDSLKVTKAQLDDTAIEVTQATDDLMVAAPVRAGQSYTLTLAYAGTPSQIPDPSERSDSAPLGFTPTADGGAWTMQEPYGASTWYAVNDQPADKALYDISVTAPSGMVGIANGTLTERVDTSTETTTRWHSQAPMASYLTTVAIGDYVATEATSASGVPLTYWVPRSDPKPLAELAKVPKLLGWLETKLGRYPFESLSFVVVPSDSAMETQTTITLGNQPGAYSADVLLHEMAHQWYGDQVTPADWRDVWMNEGMATYLQALWQDEQGDRNPGDSLMDLAVLEPFAREEAGPPGAYDPTQFAAGNVYDGPALMWAQVREQVGDETFWQITREWPASQAGTSVTREAYLAWIDAQTADQKPAVSALITDWLMSPTSPEFLG